MPLRKIPTRDGERTADYLVLLNGQRVVVEVKQLDPNPSDRDLLQRVLRREVVAYWPSGTRRIRKQIRRGGDQLKRTARGRCSTILIIYDNTSGIAGLNSTDFLNAMYGGERVHLAIPSDPGLDTVVTGHRFGGGRSLDEQRGIYVSALGWLRRERFGERPEVMLYHNAFAEIVLSVTSASALSDRQFALIHPYDGKYQEWTPVGNAGASRADG